MKKYVAAGLTLTAIGLPLSGFGQSSEVVRGELGRAFDEYMTAHAEAGFAGALLVVKAREIVLSKGYGLADPEIGYPNTPETVFDMGSIVKTFTLAAILKLEEEGKLTTHDSLASFFHNVPSDKAGVTIDQLITMSAGFHTFHDDSGDFQQMDRREAIGRILGQRLLFQPGTDRAYSNSGYTLLAAIVELASGSSFHDYVRNKLFEPAGLRSTGFYGEKVVPDSLMAIGHGGLATFGDKNAPQYWLPVTWALEGSGGVFGSLPDLQRWAAALEAGDVLSEAAVRKYEEYRRPVRTSSGQLLRFHAGGNDFGFNFVMLELIEDDGLIVFAQNNNPVGEEDPTFVRALLDIFAAIGEGSDAR